MIEPSETGLLYVVYNEWIIDPESGLMPYKIGITTKTVEDRYYGLGLKMPGNFICNCAYTFSQNSLAEIEDYIHKLFQKERISGEWFVINDTQLFALKAVCEKKGGVLITEEIIKEIESETKTNSKKLIGKSSSINGIKDHTQYSYKNVNYGKGRLVLAIVTDFIKNNPHYSYQDIVKIFPKQIQGSVGVIGEYNSVIEAYKDVDHKRHFIKDVIALSNGEKIVVSTEWGKSNISNFLRIAKELGYNIVEL